jgi:hypothetical protein
MSIYSDPELEKAARDLPDLVEKTPISHSRSIEFDQTHHVGTKRNNMINSLTDCDHPAWPDRLARHIPVYVRHR